MLRTRVSINGPTGGGVSTMYWDRTTDSAGATAIQGALSSFWTACAPVVDLSYSFVLDGVAQEIDEATGDATGAIAITPFTVTGSDSAGLAPRQLQFVVQWGTGEFVAGRQVRGRTFIPGVTEFGISGGGLHSSAVTALNGAASTLALSAANLVVYSRPMAAHNLYDSKTGALKKSYPARAGSKHSVASGTTWSKFGSLRSRRD